MKQGLVFVFGFLMMAASCEKDSVNGCSKDATVIDLTGLDGCNFAFELNDGTRLLPERRTYIQAPSKEEDPVYHYQFVAGTKVRLGFEESLAVGICMAGRIVFVTCITD